jgi:hypothetical protein
MTTTEQIPAQVPAEQGATAKPPSNLRKGLVAAAVALAIAGGGGAVVYATSGGSSSSSAVGQAPGGMGQPPNGAGTGGGDAFAGVAHGELQTGTVTAITSTSVTAASTDGYTKTYVIDAATVFAAAGGTAGTAADIAQGDTITVVASTSGDTATAVRISETS